MFSSLEEKQKVEIGVLEEFITEYEDFKQYIENVLEQDKQTPFYQHKLRIVEGVDKIYPQLTDEMKHIIHARYWYKDYQKDWAEIADELYMKVSRVKRIRNALIKKFADAIGWA